MIKGKILKPGCTIGIVAPASPENADTIDKKIEFFSSLGFKIKKGKHIYDKNGYLAGSDYARGKDLTDMFQDNSVDGIICLRGGYGSIRTLPYINFNCIKKNPKFFCGYSDITLLLNYFSKLGLITFHGPMITSDFTDKETLNSFLNVSSCNTKFIYDLNNFKNISFINKKSFYGRIVGGNLSIICSSIGTKFEIDTKNSILLIEDIGEPLYSLDRLLTQLLCCGKFHKCNGIILGTFKDCEPKIISNNCTLEEIVSNRLAPLNIPIIKGVPFGHEYPNITIPIGVSATFNASTNIIHINEQCLI